MNEATAVLNSLSEAKDDKGKALSIGDTVKYKGSEWTIGEISGEDVELIPTNPRKQGSDFPIVKGPDVTKV